MVFAIKLLVRPIETFSFSLSFYLNFQSVLLFHLQSSSSFGLKDLIVSAVEVCVGQLVSVVSASVLESEVCFSFSHPFQLICCWIWRKKTDLLFSPSSLPLDFPSFVSVAT